MEGAMNAKQTMSILIFVGGATLAGLAAINSAWRNPAIIGPFAPPIGYSRLIRHVGVTMCSILVL
jgi:hypothetical protein